MPSQQQVKWAQLRVGLTVLFAAVVLAVLIFLMGGSSGIFTHKIVIRAYFENAQGLRVGAPARLEGVSIGSVSKIQIYPKKPLTPVEVTMKIERYLSDVRKDSMASLETAGVLGETFVDISSRNAKAPPVSSGDALRTETPPGLQDVVRASQGTLQNVDILVKRLDRIVAAVESGEGSIGKLIYDETLYDRLNTTLNALQLVATNVSAGKGSIGKLVNDDELYNKLNNAVDQVNTIVDEIESGNGTIGKFLKDPSLYNNANLTINRANQLIDNVNAGKGALGKFAADEEFARKLDNTVANLRIISDRLANGDGSVALLLKNPTLYNNADQMLVETRKLVQAVRENPKRYLTIHFKVF